MGEGPLDSLAIGTLEITRDPPFVREAAALAKRRRDEANAAPALAADIAAGGGGALPAAHLANGRINEVEGGVKHSICARKGGLRRRPSPPRQARRANR